MSQLNRNCCACDELQGHIRMEFSVLVTKMFNEVTGLEAHPDSSLCKSCQQQLKVCYNFRKQCHEIFNLYEHIKPADKSVEQVFVASFDGNDDCAKHETETFDTFDSFVEDGMEQEFSELEENTELKEPSDDRSMTSDVESVETHEEWSNSKRFKCTECPKSFAKNSALICHQLNHSNQRNFTCPRPRCKSAFNVSCRLTRHLRNVHQADEDEIKTVHEANVRPTPIKSKQSLDSTAITIKTRVQCDVCMKVLGSVKYLKEHMMLQHLNNAPHLCEHEGCGKKFTNWSLFEKHKKKHEGLFDFKCKYCGKEYVQRKVLHQHLRHSHQITKEEIEEMQRANSFCSECDKAFKTPQQFLEHQALEHGTGDKFICDMCAKVFLSRIKLVSHQKYHRQDKKMSCTRCPSTFTEERGLKTHLRRVHKFTVIQIYETFMKLTVKK